ncbi:helix-turn-helix domain-containing protein [Streptomyces sp. M2CJ-2]|uniref:helix-turn-helix domain-containing protein n=1 Tax=Streptomyces sp. M2CJ-2 TaxID=2803948 RepID=UPI001923D6D8|nr:helix-turn-helix domain-containing protein [Streptomyces sp. M2CJ-2]MBL3664457.1 helix-turn-helix domain-containing protein [Streptomyces sp. M2CJ-2]
MTTTVHTPSRACYQRGCRHPECCHANYRYGKQLATEHVRGKHRLHPADEVRAHIDRLFNNGWWQAEIARAAGVSRSTVGVIVGGQQTTNKRIALAILSVPVTPMLRTDRGERVDANGSIRRLRALAILGHPFLDVGETTGMTDDRLSFIARGKTETVFPHEAQRIAAAYRTLSTTPGRMKQIATAARNKGWHGPLDWDDIDDPACQPETAAPYKPADKYKRDNDRTHEIEHLYLLGESVPSIAKQLGGSEKYIGDQLTEILRKREERAERERATKAGLEAAA